MTTIYLLDNSVIQRLQQPLVRSAVFELNMDGAIASCLPVLLEQGFSTRNIAEHNALLHRVRTGMIVLPPEPGTLDVARSIQSGLVRAGKGRAVGVSDLQIAATAIHHSTTDRPVVLVHYDRDFDHVVSIEPRLHARWIVPPGSVE